jgi:ATP-binding cassette subfamily B protein
MARLKFDFRGLAFRDVLGFTARHWRNQPVRIATIALFILVSTLADVLTPLYAGKLIDAVATGLAADAFARRQRFSTDWHANSFAGSTVRKVTRGMWALDLLNDTVLVALFPSVVMLVGSTILLGLY